MTQFQSDWDASQCVGLLPLKVLELEALGRQKETQNGWEMTQPQAQTQTQTQKGASS